MTDKIITGNWDGQPIWRQKMPSDYLAEEIEKNEKDKLLNKEQKQNEKHI